MKHILLLASSIVGALAAGIPQMAVAAQNKQVIPVMDVVRESKPAEAEPVKSEVPIKAAPVKAPKTTKPTLVKKDEPAVEETVETYQVAPPLEYSTTTYAPYNNSVPKIFDILESADGMTLHLVGLVDAGIAKALRLKLQSNPGVKTLVLSSTGGSIIEGIALAHLVTQYGLNTHVEFVCASACTFPFLSGKSRTISREGGLGFHSSSGGFSDVTGVKRNVGGNTLMREFYDRANLDPEMIEKAINTPPEDFWFPETKLLKSGNAADTITAPRSVAFPSGAWSSGDEIATITNRDGYWKKLQKNRPTYYQLALTELWTSGILIGNTREAESKSLIVLKKMLLSDFSYYPDDIVDAAIILEDELWPSYSNSDYLKCKYVGGVSIPVGSPITDEQKKKQSALLEKMAAIDVPEGDPDAATLTNAQAAVFSFLGIMVAETDHNNYSVKNSFCSKPSDYYRQLLRLPTEQRVTFFKALTLTQPELPVY